MFESDIAKTKKSVTESNMRKKLESMNFMPKSSDKFHTRKEQLKSQKVEVIGHIKRRTK